MLTVIYNLEFNPITYDFATFLAITEQTRIHLNENGIQLWIIKNRYRNKTIRDTEIDIAEKDWRLGNIILPVAGRLPSIKDLILTNTAPRNLKGKVLPFTYPKNQEVPYSSRYLNHFSKLGISPVCFEPSPQAINTIKKQFGNDKIITLTIRDSQIFSHRNTDYTEIEKMTNGIANMGLRPVVIPDHDAFLARRMPKSIWNRYLYPDAAMNLDLRMAIAQTAILNVGPSNGPVAALHLTKSVKLYQYDLLKSDHTGMGVNKGWESTNGFPVGENYPWSENGSRLRWIDYTAKNVITDIEQFIKK